MVAKGKIAYEAKKNKQTINHTHIKKMSAQTMPYRRNLCDAEQTSSLSPIQTVYPINREN